MFSVILFIFFISTSSCSSSLERSKILIKGWNDAKCNNFKDKGYFNTVKDTNSCNDNHIPCHKTRRYLRYPQLSSPNHRWNCESKANLDVRNVIVCHEHKFIFIDTPKVGSTSLATVLMKEFNLPDNPKAHLMSLKNIPKDQFDQYFVFAFVRDPVKRLESALGQANRMGSPYSHQIMLSMLVNGCFVDAHAFSMAKHLAIKHPYKNGLLEFDFLGSLENFDEDVLFLVDVLKMSPLKRKERIGNILKGIDFEPITRNVKIEHQNVGPRSSHNSLNYSDPITKKDMCHMVQHDNACFPMIASNWLSCY